MKVIILSNIADLIEAYILRQLAAKQDGKVELRRTDIADEISCAPSQISYVLSTRFTPAKGFVVESRRGLGGYIRIVQVPLKNLVYQDMMDKITEETDYATVQSMVHYLLQHAMITNREAALMMQVVSSVYQSEGMSPKERETQRIVIRESENRSEGGVSCYVRIAAATARSSILHRSGRTARSRRTSVRSARQSTANSSWRTRDSGMYR